MESWSRTAISPIQIRLERFQISLGEIRLSWKDMRILWKYAVWVLADHEEAGCSTEKNIAVKKAFIFYEVSAKPIELTGAI